MTLYKKIFGKKQSISQDEIEKYISGSLSEEEKYEIELKAQSNSIDFDTLDSFENSPTDFEEFKTLKSEISKQLYKPTNYLKYFIITGIAATISIFFIFYSDIFFKPENSKLIAENHAVQSPDNQGVSQYKDVINKELFIETVTTKETEKKNISDKTKTSTRKLKEKNSEAEYYKTENKQKTINIESIEQKELETIPVIDSINTRHKISFAYNSRIKHLIHYKVIDYSVYNRINKNEKSLNTGIDARYANEYEKTKKQSLNDKDLNITYFSFLEKALYKYDKKEYTQAISIFNTILEQYPNDLNAFFYKGLSYYRLKKYDKAIKYFNNAINSDINVFYQEAEYYKALSLLHTDKEKGKELLQKISDNALFYSQKAMIKLSEIDE